MEKRKPYVVGFFENIDGKVCEIYEFYNLESKIFLRNDGNIEHMHFIAFYDYSHDGYEGRDKFTFISREKISKEVYNVFLTSNLRTIPSRKMTRVWKKVCK